MNNAVWANTVADIIANSGSFYLVPHDAVRFQEWAETERRLVEAEADSQITNNQLAASQAREAELRTELQNAKFALAAMEAGAKGEAERNAELRKCVELYADERSWDSTKHNLFVAGLRGKIPAQTCLKELE